MITCLATDQKITALKSDGFVFFLTEDFAITGALKEFAQMHCPDVHKIMKHRKFEGKQGQVLALPISESSNGHCAIFVGVGKKKGRLVIPVEMYRRAVGSALRAASSHKCESLSVQLPMASLFGVSIIDLAKETTLTFNMANYHFTEYISDKESEIFEIILCVDKKDKKVVTNGIKIGDCIARAVNKARHWVDLPPSVLTPVHLATKAEAICKKTKLKCTVFTEKEIIKMGMGGLAGVSSGSNQDCRLLVMEYTPSKKNVETVALVGKGITFDSGGLSLKPPVHMETMKEDMSGAAAVVATMEALAELKPNVRVIGVAPLSENLPGSKATKPGDILRFYNGKTAEVKNTDAEGRLVLWDALSEAQNDNQELIIDFATLTGACRVALGTELPGFFSTERDVANGIIDAGISVNDPVWQLPLFEQYRGFLKSDVADMANSASTPFGGAITAALYLKEFVEPTTPWVHFDVMAWNLRALPGRPAGGEALGIRAVFNYLQNRFNH